MSVSLLRLPRGEIGLFYLRKDSMSDCRPVLRKSRDEGKTWGPAVEIITDEPGYYVMNNDRVVMLKSGRLLAPVALHKGPDGKFRSRGVAMCYLSDDFGRTWRRSKSTLEMPGHPESRTGLQEPGVIQLKDGRLMMLCRTDLGCQYASYSPDGGETWSPAERTAIRSPASPASIARIPSTGDLLLVWNDNYEPTMAGNAGRRTPFNVAVSTDEGKTWTREKSLETDPNGWYCYTAVDFVDGRVLLAHCAGDSRVNGLGTLQITAFPVDWLYQPVR